MRHVVLGPLRLVAVAGLVVGLTGAMPVTTARAAGAPPAPIVAPATSVPATQTAQGLPAPSPAAQPGGAPPLAVPLVPTAQDDPLTVEILTFGPGTHPFTRFGHNAIRIIDRRAGTDMVYNFGTFTFDSPRLILDFLAGRLRYWLSRSSMASAEALYRRENRDIEAQELNLSAEQKRELATRLEVNARPENRNYRYDYFADNCSTRVRDALDAVLQGRLRASAVGPGTMSLRSHALRMAADDLPLYTALLIVLGPRTDRPIDEWAEAFLPEMLQRTLRTAPAWRGAEGSGGTGHLVKSERVIFADDRAAALREPPNRVPAFLGIGVIAGLLVFLLGHLGGRFPAGRVVFGVVLAGLGLTLGGVGAFLTLSWSFTPHVVVYRNENVLLFAPFTLSLVVLGLGTALGRPGAMRKAFLVSAAALGLAAAASALKMFPWSRQDNGALILMMLPLWWGITAGVRAVGARRVSAG